MTVEIKNTGATVEFVFTNDTGSKYVKALSVDSLLVILRENDGKQIENNNSFKQPSKETKVLQ